QAEPVTKVVNARPRDQTRKRATSPMETTVSTTRGAPPRIIPTRPKLVAAVTPPCGMRTSQLFAPPGRLRSGGEHGAARTRGAHGGRRRTAAIGQKGRACIGDRPRRQATPLIACRSRLGQRDDQSRRVPAAVTKRVRHDAESMTVTPTKGGT